MFDINDIVVRLTAGEAIDEIAQEAADVLNAAKAQYDKEQKEREAKAAAEKKAADIQKRKREYAEEITDLFIDYANEFHPAFLNEEKIEQFLDYDVVANLLDLCFTDAQDEFDAIQKEIEKAFRAAEAPKKTEVLSWDDAPKELKEAVDPILDFLAKNNLI